MRECVSLAMGFIERCEHYQELSQLVADLSRTLQGFGFNYFMMTRLPALNENAEPYVIAHTWPEQWLSRYREAAYFWHDPVSIFSLTRAKPFTWKEARQNHKKTRISLKLASEATGLGLADGIGFPMGDPSSVQAVVSLAADHRVELDTMSREMLHLVCLNAEIRAVELLELKARPLRPLTQAEREVLRWIANGKTFADIADILVVSERTIRAHAENSRNKLSATTTTHAVAKAIRSRQIIL
jgi:LuxR family transcriptional regulator, quorum-sensing system regulator BjaR1